MTPLKLLIKSKFFRNLRLTLQNGKRRRKRLLKRKIEGTKFVYSISKFQLRNCINRLRDFFYLISLNYSFSFRFLWLFVVTKFSFLCSVSISNIGEMLDWFSSHLLLK